MGPPSFEISVDFPASVKAESPKRPVAWSNGFSLDAFFRDSVFRGAVLNQICRSFSKANIQKYKNMFKTKSTKTPTLSPSTLIFSDCCVLRGQNLVPMLPSNILKCDTVYLYYRSNDILNVDFAPARLKRMRGRGILKQPSKNLSAEQQLHPVRCCPRLGILTVTGTSYHNIISHDGKSVLSCSIVWIVASDQFFF